jgi:hypothetical protein
MSWTAPRTWTSSEVISAAIMNTHVRDEFLETAPAKASAAAQQVFSTAANAIAMVTGSKYKTADETVNNSTTLQNDDHLAWTVAANEVWAFHGFLYFTVASGDPGAKWTFTVPASCTGWYLVNGPAANVDGAGVADQAFPGAIATTRTYGVSGLTSFLVALDGVIINGANAGTVQFQWAQNSLVASDLKLKLGSYLDLKRLA